MSTFAYDFFQSIENRWKEIDRLLENAEEKSDNEELYDSLCRATIVLMVANLEGFIKETVKVILNDINTFSNFCDAPSKLKITFCSTFIDINENPQKVFNLIKEFDELETKFKVEPFLFENNKNPSPSIIDKICNKFGIENFFPMIEESNINVVFENDKEETEGLINSLRNELLKGSKEYPYTLDLELFNLNIKAKKSKKGGLWRDFLDELLRKRHAIAHGTTFKNEVSSKEILQLKQKVKILQYILAIILLEASIKKEVKL